MAEQAGSRWTIRLADVWGHVAHEVLSASIVAAIVMGIRPPTGRLAVSVPVSLMAVVIASWILMRRHDRRLCEQCVMEMPLNAAEKSARYENRFWMAHIGAERRFLMPYLAVLIGSNFLPGTWGRLVWAVIQCSMVYLILGHVTHRRFQPWCPWCNGGGGGGRELDDDLPPTTPPSNRELV